MRRPLLTALVLAASPASQALAQHPIPRAYAERVVGETCTLLRQYYVHPDVGAQICDSLRQRLRRGTYDTAATIAGLTGLLTADLRSVNGDRHLRAQPMPRAAAGASGYGDAVATHLRFILNHKAQAFGIAGVRQLDGNIGYLDLRQLRPLPNREAERMIRSAMELLSNSDALIVDLRSNGGGHLNMVEFLSSYFFDSPTRLSDRYLRETGGTTPSWTLDRFDDKRFVDVPLFILTSARTISAPEVFAYDLQALRRATIVGETTAGSVNSARFFRVMDSMQVLIATGFVTNPITHTHVEGRGIRPDLEVPAERALEACLELAQPAARRHREARATQVEGYVDRLRAQLAAVESSAARDPDQAERAVREIVRGWYEMDFMNPYLLLDLGDAYLQRGRPDLAIAVLKQGGRYYAGAFETYAFLLRIADAYERLGDRESAARHVAQYLALYPHDQAAAARLRALAGSPPAP